MFAKFITLVLQFFLNYLHFLVPRNLISSIVYGVAAYGSSKLIKPSIYAMKKKGITPNYESIHSLIIRGQDLEKIENCYDIMKEEGYFPIYDDVIGIIDDPRISKFIYSKIKENGNSQHFSIILEQMPYTERIIDDIKLLLDHVPEYPLKIRHHTIRNFAEMRNIPLMKYLLREIRDGRISIHPNNSADLLFIGWTHIPEIRKVIRKIHSILNWENECMKNIFSLNGFINNKKLVIYEND